jgi:hypothetical protein
MDYIEHSRSLPSGEINSIQLLSNADRSILLTENETGPTDSSDEVIFKIEIEEGILLSFDV